MSENNTPGPERHANRAMYWLAQILAPLVVGVVLSFGLIPVPKVGIIRLEGEIYDTMADYVVAQLEHARLAPSIRAVVLKVNSPGGGVTPSESLYLSLLRFRESKPLVVSVDTLAASGGYYAASAGEKIFAKPSSSVGNVGVVSFMPLPTYVDEEMITTGPLKLFGSSRADYTREMELLKRGFVRSVTSQRGDRLKVSADGLASGEMYVGMRALELGLIDSLGTLPDAANEAARLAHVAHYETVALESLVPDELPTIEPPIAGQSAKKTTRLPGTYYLYVNPAEVVR